MHWKIAQAKQSFSELVRRASKEPQLIYSRERLVAAVIDAAAFQEFQAWREQKERTSLAEAFQELRKLCAEERSTLEPAPRRDRRNTFTDALPELPR
jgi:prevent-host-death family protein